MHEKQVLDRILLKTIPDSVMLELLIERSDMPKPDVYFEEKVYGFGRLVGYIAVDFLDRRLRGITFNDTTYLVVRQDGDDYEILAHRTEPVANHALMNITLKVYELETRYPSLSGVYVNRLGDLTIQY